jgi:DNA-directed RNA polymerase specialized sigma24 family protein
MRVSPLPPIRFYLFNPVVPNSEPSPDDNGVGGLFCATRWSMVLAAGGADSPEARRALEDLFRAYWYPLYAHVRGRGFDAEDARDLTQGFIASLLERESLASVSPERGRFRTFLLTALKFFLADDHAHRRAAKRGGGVSPVALDSLDPEGRYRLEPASNESPDRLFDRRWAAALMERVLGQLRNELEADGKSAQFHLLRPFLAGDAGAGEYERIAAAEGVPANTIAQQVRRLRQRLRKLAIEEASHTVTAPGEAESELRALFT